MILYRRIKSDAPICTLREAQPTCLLSSVPILVMDAVVWKVAWCTAFFVCFEQIKVIVDQSGDTQQTWFNENNNLPIMAKAGYHPPGWPGALKPMFSLIILFFLAILAPNPYFRWRFPLIMLTVLDTSRSSSLLFLTPLDYNPDFSWQLSLRTLPFVDISRV